MSCRSSQLKHDTHKLAFRRSTAADNDHSVKSLCSLSPARHGPALCDGVAPHVETHTDDGAGQEDREHHQGADQQVEEGVEDGAAGR